MLGCGGAAARKIAKSRTNHTTFLRPKLASAKNRFSKSWIPAVGFYGLFVIRATAEVTDVKLESNEIFSNWVQCIRGDIPIAYAEVGVEGKFVEENGFTPAEPVFFEVSRQEGTFYFRRLWEISAGKLLSVSNGIVYGTNQDCNWILTGTKVYVSRITTNPTLPEELDRVGNEIESWRGLAFSPFRLGFPETWEPVSALPGNSLLVRGSGSQKGREVIAKVQSATDGLPRTISWMTSNSVLTAEITLEYSYSAGNHPNWFPSSIRSSATEIFHKDSKRVTYSDNRYVRECVFGTKRIIGGYSPEMFIPGGKAEIVQSWTNGIGVVIEGTNISRILPANTPSAARVGTKHRMIGRRVILSLISGSILLLVWMVLRQLRSAGNRKH